MEEDVRIALQGLREEVMASLLGLTAGLADVKANTVQALDRLNKINGTVGEHSKLMPLHCSVLERIDSDLKRTKERIYTDIGQRLTALEEQHAVEEAASTQKARDAANLFNIAKKKATEMVTTGVVLFILYFLVKNVPGMVGR